MNSIGLVIEVKLRARARNYVYLICLYFSVLEEKENNQLNCYRLSNKITNYYN